METPLKELIDTRKHLFDNFLAGKVTGAFENEYAEIIDQYLRRSVQESSIGQRLFRRGIPFAFVAVGGYGRKELCVKSDIDVILLFRRTIPSEAKAIMREVLWPLWDAGLDVGYGTRTLRDCIGLSMTDFSVLTSILDARLVCGDSPLYLELMDRLRSKLLGKRRKASFLRWIQNNVPLRLKLYGEAGSMLEPNLKEGIGGLRDYHSMLWVSKVFFGLIEPRDLEYHGALSHQEFLELEKYLSLIWSVRNRLHLISGRKNDRLVMEYQEQIAQDMGYKKREGLKAVEIFLGDVHTSMAGIRSLTSSFFATYLKTRKNKKRREKLGRGIELINDELYFVSPQYILSHPKILMNIFAISAISKSRLSLEARRLVREFVYLVDEEFLRSKESSLAFLSILNAPGAFEALEVMAETGLLGAYIPEFKNIKDRVQFDTYHIYPVGRHLLETVKKIKEIRREGELILTTILSEVKNPEVLLLAALFHDIGKTGQDHSKRGAKLVRRILSRLCLDKRIIEEVSFLVGHHLLLIETALRRDLDDEKIVVQCARTIESIDRLKMLYLLTWADSAATGPRAWNDWVANLVQELFFKVLHILAREELATDDSAHRLRRIKTFVFKRLGAKMSRNELEKVFENMSPRYLLNMSPAKVLEHISLARELKAKATEAEPTRFVLKPRLLEAERCWEITFVGYDRPGLFSDIAGVMALNNVNILSAKIHTWSDGTVVDIFQVTPPLDPLRPQKTWEKIRKDLSEVFSGRASLVDMLASKSQRTMVSKSRLSTRQPQVIIDNKASDFFTVIEVFADDRPGVLYHITRALFGLGLDIRIAKISTKVDQITDVFYVRDRLGQKVTNREDLERIKRILLKGLK